MVTSCEELPSVAAPWGVVAWNGLRDDPALAAARHAATSLPARNSLSEFKLQHDPIFGQDGQVSGAPIHVRQEATVRRDIAQSVHFGDLHPASFLSGSLTARGQNEPGKGGDDSPTATAADSLHPNEGLYLFVP